MDKQDIFTREETYHIQTYKRLPVVFVKGEDVYLWDSEGKKYVDFIAGLGVVNIGHSQPRVVEAVRGQIGRLTHVSNLFYTRPQADLAERLVGLTISGGKCFFGNSGAEANEGAIKLARRYGKTKFSPERLGIITAWRSFHGRTIKTLAATGQPEKQRPFQPLPGGFKHVPYNDIEALQEAVDAQTVAVMLEVVQGEGGVYPADLDYLRSVRRLCDRKELLLILDEVQTGMGRTGKMFAWQHYDIEPDIVTAAKGLADGLPIGVVVAGPKTAAVLGYGDHGSTFGGGPVVCAAALATIDVLESEGLPERAAAVGAYFKEKLRQVATETGLISEVRGRGLMLGVELREPRGPEIVVAMLARGFIINNIGRRILRFLPPLTIGKEHIDAMLSALTELLKE